jgi:F-type H+-transporting ATPase subunit a
MDLKEISPDQVVYLQWGPFDLNATIAYTWAVMAILVIASIVITAKLSTGEKMSRWQNLLEIVVSYMRKEIADIAQHRPERYLPLIGTLFIFIFVSNVLGVAPGFTPPTASLSTTAALAICVFFSVIIYGVIERGVVGYLKQYVQPTPLMLPFNVIGEFSRTLALAVRLFGNMMSGAKIVAILLAVTPFIFPVVMNLLGLLTGVIQAYIFAVLAMVYIASATRRQQQEKQQTGGKEDG